MFTFLSKPLSINNTFKIKFIPVDMIITGKKKLRNYDEDLFLDPLVQSLKDYGMLQPILVRKLENDMYEVIVGYRRFFAAKKANLKKIPAIFISEFEKKLPILFLSENLHRKNLNFFDEADALFYLIDQFNFSQDMIADFLGLSQSFIADRLKLLKIHHSLRDEIIKLNLNLEEVQLVTLTDDKKKQRLIIDQIVKNRQSFNQLEFFIKQYVKNDFKSFDEIGSSKKINGETLYIVKDVRFFDNTISQAIDVMNNSGVDALSVRNESEDFIEYLIKIPKDKVYIKKSVGF